MSSSGVGYENLIYGDCEQHGCDDSLQDCRRDFSKRGKTVSPEAADSANTACRFVAITVMMLLTVGAAAVSAVAAQKFFAPKGRIVECGYMRFVLNSDSIGQCRLDSGHYEPPCQVNSSASSERYGAALVTSTLYNNAIGPWKLGETAKLPADGKDDGSRDACDIKLTRKDTHLVIGKSGLYQLSAQITFSPVINTSGYQIPPAADSQVVWQVNNVEWVAAHRRWTPEGGPEHTYLSAVRRLQAGQRISLHLTWSANPMTRISMEAASTHILVSML